MHWSDCGLNLLDPRFALNDTLGRASDAGVLDILVISSTIEESEKAAGLIRDHNTHQISANDAPSQSVFLAQTAGVHPHYADNTNSETWTKLKRIMADTQVVAVGECGLDFNRNFSSQANQIYAFEQQLALASEHNMGVYLHERDAFDTQISLLEKYAKSLPFMVAHCFTGNKSQLQAYLELNCFVGITGWLCDNKRGKELQNAVRDLPLERLLLETDGPYLFPKTLKPRKSINEPCNIPYIANAVAELTGTDVDTIKQFAFQNANKLFFNRGMNEHTSNART
ncbi:TatD family hydrolase [Glaciecola sp. 2405UD65-10]|uniref:TatD family hydrolase n=1 Tax=Glaciecola sp. 2405UD65-10 TaxID=3397244 RepID=UPI003B5C8BBB